MALAAAAGMREMVVRAHLHQAAAGHAPAAAAARVLASEIDNPKLLAEVQGAGPEGCSPASLCSQSE
jgi:hypothetical protein